VLLIPGLREVATWNLLLVLRRGPAADPASAHQPAAPGRASAT
jgi:hypothetical protein